MYIWKFLRRLRNVCQSAIEYFDGFKFGSYSLEDEVDLALSFIQSRQVKSLGVVIDAGANTGNWSSTLLRSSPQLSKLVLVEPNSEHKFKLKILCERNDFTSLESVALGAEKSQMSLYFDSTGSTLASLYDRDLSHIGVELNHSVVVDVDTLDAIAQRNAISHIDYLKLDLEGHELSALIGAKHLLRRSAISAICFEFGGCNIDSKTYMKDFWKLLCIDHQFSLYRLAPNRKLIRLRQYSESLERFNWQNLLACAPGVTPPWTVID